MSWPQVQGCQLCLTGLSFWPGFMQCWCVCLCPHWICQSLEDTSFIPFHLLLPRPAWHKHREMLDSPHHTDVQLNHSSAGARVGLRGWDAHQEPTTHIKSLPLLTPASFWYTPWEAGGEGLGGCVPASHVGDLSWAWPCPVPAVVGNWGSEPADWKISPYDCIRLFAFQRKVNKYKHMFLETPKLVGTSLNWMLKATLLGRSQGEQEVKFQGWDGFYWAFAFVFKACVFFCVFVKICLFVWK